MAEIDPLLIEALGSATAVEATSWGRIKAERK